MRAKCPTAESLVRTYKQYGITAQKDLTFNILVILQFYDRKVDTFNWLSI
jgi:hypothetical protein